MSERYASRSFRSGGLPAWKPWLSRISGALCFAAAGLSAVAVWEDPSAIGVVVFGVCVIAGALLISLPEYFRYYAALRTMQPLPDRIEEAFEETYENLREIRDALERVGRMAEERVGSESTSVDEVWKNEMEEALSELRLDCDDLTEKLRPLVPDDGKEGGRSLPPGMLAKALSGAGKGKGFPLPGGKEESD